MKKVIAIFTILSFLINITSCYTYRTLTTQDEYNEYIDNKLVHVWYIKTKQGNIIEFNQFYPGKIAKTFVGGLPQLRLSPGEQDSSIFLNKRLKGIWKNGINYELIKQDTLGYICHASDTIQIPLSDIEQLRFSEIKVGETAILSICITITTFLILGLIAAPNIDITR